jgi:ParB family transcriptional regulator, chromosome partitioning protein
MEKKALGKGLEALLPDSKPKAPTAQDVQQVPLDRIIPNPFQPRTHFDAHELEELTESIKANGVLQPVLVRRKAEGLYELIAGERRFRAAKQAGLTAIPVVIRNTGDQQAMELALVENIQRSDLNPIEAARAYQRLTREFGLTHEHIAERVGKDRSSISNIARLLNLPNEIQELVQAGALSTGHAKVLLGIASATEQLRLAQLITASQLSVREAERLAGGPAKKRPAQRAGHAHADLEERLRRRLGTKVTIAKSGKVGKIVLHFFSDDEFSRLADVLLA